MAIIKTDDAHYQAIADKIREKTGSSTTYKPSEMPSGIEEVYAAGGNGGGVSLPSLSTPASESEVFAGKEYINESGTKVTGTFTIDEELTAQDSLIAQIQTALEGKAAGGGNDDGSYDEGYTAGQQAERGAFWDDFQANGARTDYQHAFIWATDASFKPKYSMAPTGNYEAVEMFMNSKITDLKSILEECGVTLDFSQAGRITSLFRKSSVTTVPTIDMSSCTNSQQAFYDMYNLKEVNIVNLQASCTFVNTFAYCRGLEVLTISGTIGQSGLNFTQSTKLTHDSIMNVINALETKTSGTWTVTFGSTNLAKLTDAEKAIATEKGWTLA